MLTDLTIQNLALIQSLTLETAPGFSVITGESGSGKSVTIEALHLVFGERAAQHLIRQGAKKAEARAIFDISQLPEIRDWLDQHDLAQEPPHHEECVIRRVISADGPSRGYINNIPSPLSHLKFLGTHLLTLIGQHQQQYLTQKETMTALLDHFGNHAALYRQTLDARKAWKHLETEITETLNQQQAAKERQTLQEYQLAELKQIDLDNFESLTLQHQQLSHAQHNQQLLDSTLALLSDKPGNNMQLACHSAQQHLHNIQPQNEAIQQCLEFLQQMQIYIEESQALLNQENQAIQHNPSMLAEINQTLSKIHALAKKHQMPPEELAAFAQQLETELQQYEAQQHSLSDKQTECQRLKDTFITLAGKLNEARKKSAPKLAKALAQKVRPLGMQEFRCEFHFQANESEDNPIDSCELLMATHDKQDCLSLRKIASGGELSRIRLGLSLINAMDTPRHLMIFDEIDTGVSGKIAENIGDALLELSQHHQVLCITHSPQIAARAHHHYQVSKHKKSQGMQTQMRLLSSKEKRNELARMIGGEATEQENLTFADAILNAVRG